MAPGFFGYYAHIGALVALEDSGLLEGRVSIVLSSPDLFIFDHIFTSNEAATAAACEYLIKIAL